MPSEESTAPQTTKTSKHRRHKALLRRKARRVRTPYDAIYKLAFSFLEMMADLLREYIPVTGPLRYETLERFPDTYINRELRERREDLIWRVQSCHSEWCYIYILTEFQSRNDPLMAIRIAEYVSVFLHGLYRSAVLKLGDKLPLVVPVVLHNGLDTWTAPLSLAEMEIPVPEPLHRLQPQQAYFLLDVKDIPQDKLANKRCLQRCSSAWSGCATLMNCKRSSTTPTFVWMARNIRNCALSSPNGSCTWPSVSAW